MALLSYLTPLLQMESFKTCIPAGAGTLPGRIFSRSHLFSANDIASSSSNELWVSFLSANLDPNVDLRLAASLAGKEVSLSEGQLGTLQGERLLQVEPSSQLQLLLHGPRNQSVLLYGDFDSSPQPFLQLLLFNPIGSVTAFFPAVQKDTC